MAKGPLFLHRKSYRKRRLMDVIRLLPLLGLALWMVPLIWPGGDMAAQATVGAVSTSVALRYLFSVWIVLVLLGWLLWRATASRAEMRDNSTEDMPD